MIAKELTHSEAKEKLWEILAERMPLNLWQKITYVLFGGYSPSEPTLKDVLVKLQEKFSTKEKNCLNYHTNDRLQLSIHCEEFGEDAGFLDIDLTEPFDNWEEHTHRKLLELLNDK